MTVSMVEPTSWAAGSRFEVNFATIFGSLRTFSTVIAIVLRFARSVPFVPKTLTWFR